MRISSDGSGISLVSPSRPRPDGEEYVQRLKDKVQMQAKQLHALTTQLDEANEYRYGVCVCGGSKRQQFPRSPMYEGLHTYLITRFDICVHEKARCVSHNHVDAII